MTVATLEALAATPFEQRYFFDVVMAAKDAWGTAFCCGTSSVIRRAMSRMGSEGSQKTGPRRRRDVTRSPWSAGSA